MIQTLPEGAGVREMVGRPEKVLEGQSSTARTGTGWPAAPPVPSGRRQWRLSTEQRVLWSQMTRVHVPALVLTTCITSGKVLNLSVCAVVYAIKLDPKSTYPGVLLPGLKELIRGFSNFRVHTNHLQILTGSGGPAVPWDLEPHLVYLEVNTCKVLRTGPST